MKGDPYKRCGCTDVVDGRRRQLGARCPRLRRADGSWNPRHGTWTFAISVTSSGGKREQVVRGGYATQAEAKDARDRLKERARRGQAVKDVKVDIYLREWLRTKKNIKKGTARSYKVHVEFFCLHLGHLWLSELRVGQTAEALDDAPGGDANRQRYRATLRVALNRALREGLVHLNVAALVELPGGKRPKALVWTVERVARWRVAVARLEASDSTGAELEALEKAARPPSAVMVWTPALLGCFLDAAADDRLYGLYHVIAHLGLRRGEACGLRWVDVDLDAETLTVAVQLTQAEGWTPIEDSPKSEAGERTVAMDAGTVKVLRAHRKHQLEARLEWGKAWVDSGRVFTREDGSELHPATVTDRFHEIAAAADVPPIRLHDLRHGAASLMLAAGVDIKIVSETLGHSSRAITSDTYTSVFPQVAKAAAEATAALIPRSRTGTEDDTPLTHSPRIGGLKNGPTRSNSGPPGDRTPNPRIKSPLLCRLS